mmetsp:Transcript_4474/g.9306  ORF Transcript_4474/g.9306 Transcript_4474/m.9306 type:complete len:122 (+) Transcript_4474:110-475(+)
MNTADLVFFHYLKNDKIIGNTHLGLDVMVQSKFISCIVARRQNYAPGYNTPRLLALSNLFSLVLEILILLLCFLLHRSGMILHSMIAQRAETSCGVQGQRVTENGRNYCVLTHDALMKKMK